MKKAEFDVVYLHEGDVIATSSAACAGYLWYIHKVDSTSTANYPTGYAVGSGYEYDGNGSWILRNQEEEYRLFDGFYGFSTNIEAGKWYHVDEANSFGYQAGNLSSDHIMTLCTKEHTFN